MGACNCCGIEIPDGQRTCSMCYGDISHGTDGYYEQLALEQERKQLEETAVERGYVIHTGKQGVLNYLVALWRELDYTEEAIEIKRRQAELQLSDGCYKIDEQGYELLKDKKDDI